MLAIEVLALGADQDDYDRMEREQEGRDGRAKQPARRRQLEEKC